MVTYQSVRWRKKNCGFSVETDQSTDSAFVVVVVVVVLRFLRGDI